MLRVFAFLCLFPSFSWAGDFSGIWEGKGTCSSNFSETGPCDFLFEIQQSADSLQIKDCTEMGGLRQSEIFCIESEYQILNQNELWMETEKSGKSRVGSIGAEDISLQFSEDGVSETESYHLSQDASMKHQSSYADDSGFEGKKEAVLRKREGN